MIKSNVALWLHNYILIFSVDVWGCPPGYFMLASNCYKMVRSMKMFAEAEVACLAEGAMLAKPITLLQVGSFSYIFSDDAND